MSVKIFPPQATTSTLAAAMAASLTGDWVTVSDGRGYTGRVLSEIIGPSFDPYARIKTAAEIAADPAAVTAIEGNGDALDALGQSPTAVPLFVFELSLGTPFAGGFIAPDIDTTTGNIIPADASQTGLDYRLIVGPKALQESGLMWKTSRTAGPPETQTRWDGLSATMAMVAAGAEYPAASYCESLEYPDDGGSQWYLPAMDELEALYRAFKPTTENNYTSDTSAGDFPPSAQLPGGKQSPGYNPSSNPASSAYSASSPGQTSLTPWQDGNAEAFGAQGQNIYFWSATEYNAAGAWFQTFSGSFAGRQNFYSKDNTAHLVRPVRRFVR